MHDAPHHEHGTMDIVEHERTFDGFVRFMTWSAVLTILVLIFLALTNA
nr:aa3-type cytochrome c oxidase subunit IV [Paracoccus sanguinis]